MRHDVEFNIDDALEIGKIDDEEGVPSTFFFQLRNCAYNLFSPINVSKLRVLLDSNREVGLHLYISHLEEENWVKLVEELEIQSSILQSLLGRSIQVFSTHRPPRWFLKRRVDKLNGLTNVYGPSYFEYSENQIPREIVFLTDSRHRWKYGHPFESFRPQKFQLSIHPDEWSEKGGNSAENFSRLFRHKINDIAATFRRECDHFAEVADEVEF